MSSATLALPGCTPEPLMSCLKALGVFRLVAEQADPEATLSWRGGVAHLDSKLDRDELIEFFAEPYRPTPIVAPWNGGSGFYGGGSEPLEAIATSDVDRPRLYRETIGRIRQSVPNSKPKDDDKEALLIRCRSELPDEVVPWLEACFVLGEARVTFFPLLGTGGNDGRLGFTNNFMQRLAEVAPLRADAAPLPQSRSLPSAALFADTLVCLGRTAIGHLLGVNRGVKAFARYGFLKRSGLAFLATPLGRMTVELRPKARLLNDPPITEWLERWRRACSDKDKTPARYQSVLLSVARRAPTSSRHRARNHPSDPSQAARGRVNSRTWRNDQPAAWETKDKSRHPSATGDPGREFDG